MTQFDNSSEPGRVAPNDQTLLRGIAPGFPSANATPEVGYRHAVEALQREVGALRVLFLALILVVLVFSASLNVFLLRQIITLSRQSTEISQMVQEYNEKQVPIMKTLEFRLREFGKTHPDFQPLVIKYFGTNPAAPAESSVVPRR